MQRKKVKTKNYIIRSVTISLMLLNVLFFSGCSNDQSSQREQMSENSRAYVNKSNSSEDDAVNTLQVGSKYKIVSPMMELKDAVVEILGDNYWPDALLTEEEMAERTGISSSMYENFMAEYQHSEAGIDMMIIIEAKEDSIADVEKYMNEYRELLLKIYEKQPQNKAKVFASRIEIIQNYVCYVQLGADITGLEELGEDKMVEHCQHDNERALDIIEKTILSREENS